MESFIYFAFCIAIMFFVVAMSAIISFVGGSIGVITLKIAQPKRKNVKDLIWIFAIYAVVGGLILLIIVCGSWWVN